MVFEFSSYPAASRFVEAVMDWLDEPTDRGVARRYLFPDELWPKIEPGGSGVPERG